MEDLHTVRIPIDEYDELRAAKKEYTVISHQLFNGERFVYEGKNDAIQELTKKLNEVNRLLDKERKLNEAHFNQITVLREELIIMGNKFDKIKSKWYYKFINGEK